jgi:hypothetical protein
VALVHVAAVLDPEVKDARIQAWGHSVHWNEVLAVLRELCPERTFVDDYPESYHLQVSVDQSQSVELMKKWSGKADRSGWTTLKESIVENVRNPYLEA